MEIRFRNLKKMEESILIAALGLIQGMGPTTRSEAAEGDDDAVEDSIFDSAGWWDMAEPRRVRGEPKGWRCWVVNGETVPRLRWGRKRDASGGKMWLPLTHRTCQCIRIFPFSLHRN